MKDQPNILLIIADQLTWSAVGATGNPWLQTPNMDRLCREGVSFDRSYCAAPVCGPSRLSLVTGLPPHEHGYTHHFAQPWDWKQRGLTSFGHNLRDAGYDTRWIGKWHATEYLPRTADSTPGFTNMPAPASDTEGFGITSDAVWTGQAVDFLSGRPTAPFFLGLSLLNPHDICYSIMNMLPSDTSDQLMAPAGMQLPPLPDNFDVSVREPAVMRFRRTEKAYGPELMWTTGWDELDWRRYLYAYYRLVEIVDRQIGRTLDALDASGLADNTLVILTSDHGEGAAAHRLVVKLSVYEEALRVPLIMRYPGLIPDGRRLDCPVSGLDLAPTILDFAGAQPLPIVRGVSLRTAAIGGAQPSGRTVVSELHPTMDRLDAEARILCGSRYKYIISVDDAIEEWLYDLESDPGETANLACDSPMRDAIGDYRRDLAAWMRETDDPLLRREDVARLMAQTEIE